MTPICATCGAEGRPEAASCWACGATLAGSGGWHWSEAEADEAPAGALPARSLGALLKETWACFARHWVGFYAVGLLSQTPVLLEPLLEERPFPLPLALEGTLGLLAGALFILASAADQAGEAVSFKAALGPAPSITTACWKK